MDYLPPFYSSEGHPAKNQAQILRSLILFTLLLNQTDAKTILTSWVRDVLPNSIFLPCLCSFSSVENLPSLGSYYDLMTGLYISNTMPTCVSIPVFPEILLFIKKPTASVLPVNR